MHTDYGNRTSTMSTVVLASPLSFTHTYAHKYARAHTLFRNLCRHIQLARQLDCGHALGVGTAELCPPAKWSLLPRGRVWRTPHTHSDTQHSSGSDQRERSSERAHVRLRGCVCMCVCLCVCVCVCVSNTEQSRVSSRVLMDNFSKKIFVLIT